MPPRPSLLDETAENKPPTGKPPPAPNVVADYGDNGDYDDFAVAEENFLEQRQKRPLEVPKAVLSVAGAAHGDYSNLQEVAEASNATEKSLEPPKTLGTGETPLRSRDSFGSDYEEPMVSPQHIITG